MSELTMPYMIYCLLLVPEVNITTTPITETTAITADHKPALNIPAIAEQPPIRISAHASIHSVKGFIRPFFIRSKKTVPHFLYLIISKKIMQ